MTNWTSFVYFGEGESSNVIISDNALVPIQEINLETEEQEVFFEMDDTNITVIIEHQEEFTLIVKQEQNNGS